MRFLHIAHIATAASLVMAAATFACSGSSSSSSPSGTSSGDDTPDGSQASLPPDDTNNQPVTGDETTPTTPPTDGGGTPSDASDPQLDADIGDGSAGQLCLVGDTKEVEPNNAAGTATPVSGIPSVFCGHLDPGDTDFLSFTLNAATFKSSWNYSASPIALEATVEGQTFDLNGNNYVYKQGKEYVIKITAAAATDYRLKLTN